MLQTMQQLHMVYMTLLKVLLLWVVILEVLRT
nr:MAG TPA: hypothetical protein [Bacteriophage sp.]